MSTLKVNRIEPRTGDTVEIVGFEAPTTPIKAWVRFNGTPNPPNVICSKGVSSITDNGVGQYQVNFTNPFGATDKMTAMCTSKSDNGRLNSFTQIYNVNYISVDCLFSLDLTDMDSINLWVIEE